MKISKEEKAQNKEMILEVAVKLISEKGFKATSMREIAKHAGVSDPTVYNYFASKEKIVYFYIESRHQKALDILLNIENFHEFTLREQLQTLFETELDLYDTNRAFITEVFEMAFYSSTVKMKELYGTKELFITIIRDMFQAGIDANEIEEPPMFDLLTSLMWDYFIATVAYWVKDESEHTNNTSEFIEHTLSLLETMLMSNILSKLSGFGVFLFKTHVLSHLPKFGKSSKKMMGLKRKFMDLSDD